jgi:hypothetical protein
VIAERAVNGSKRSVEAGAPKVCVGRRVAPKEFDNVAGKRLFQRVIASGVVRSLRWGAVAGASGGGRQHYDEREHASHSIILPDASLAGTW